MAPLDNVEVIEKRLWSAADLLLGVSRTEALRR